MAQFLDPSVVRAEEKKLNGRELARAIRQSIAAEEEAIHLYEFFADVSEMEEARKVFQDIADEEKVHVGEFQALLNHLMADEEGFLEEGANEVDDLMEGSQEKAFLRGLSELVEKGRVRKKPRYKIKDMWKALADAAKKKRKCLVRYKKSRKRGGGTYEYYVAPYSFRTKPGGEVLFAYDLVDGHIKSFFRENVTGVHVTDNRFVPKWDIEIGTEKSLDVHESFYRLGLIAKQKEQTEKGAIGSPPKPKKVAGSPKPKIAKPQISARP